MSHRLLFVGQRHTLRLLFASVSAVDAVVDGWPSGLPVTPRPQSHNSSHGTELNKRRRRARGRAQSALAGVLLAAKLSHLGVTFGLPGNAIMVGYERGSTHEPPVLMPACGLGGW